MDEPTRAATLTAAAFGPALDPLLLVPPGHAWYVDLDKLLPREHYGVTAQLDNLFRENRGPGQFIQVGLAGQGGTGKSTLVRQSMEDLRQIGILPVYVNARESFDQANIAFADVVLVLIEAVVRTLVERGETIALSPKLLERVRHWFVEEIVGETHSTELLGELQTEASTIGGIPLLASLAARLKGTVRSDNVYRTEIRRRAARDPEELISGANALLDGVHAALADRKQRICVVFDNLEKLADRSQVDSAILRRSDDLARLRCHIIYFLSPVDIHAPTIIQANQSLKVIEVPVIPIRESAEESIDVVHEHAIRAIHRLIERRIDLDRLFADPGECVRALARWSGGRLRDVIELARQACEFADFDAKADRVSVEHVDRAARKLGRTRLTVMTPDAWACAVEIHTTKAVGNRPEDMLMLLNALVLAYDGQPWWDVHPFLLHDPRFAARLGKT
ncbi:AAA family ATPase [Nannocystaceae bacterium ST9]